jgi:hypothetical protein
MQVSELQLRLDSVKQEAGANKVKLQVTHPLERARVHSEACIEVLTCVLCQALVAEWEQVQAQGGPKSLSAGSLQSSYNAVTIHSSCPPSSAADAELKLKVERMHEAQGKIALLKIQTQEADAALAGAVGSLHAFFCDALFGLIILFCDPSAMEAEIAAEGSKGAALMQANAELKRRCTEAQVLCLSHYNQYPVLMLTTGADRRAHARAGGI